MYGRNHHNIIKQLSSNKKGGSSNGDPVWVNFCNDFRDYFTFSEYVLDVYDGAVRGCWGDRDALSIVGPCPRVVYLIVKELEARQINKGICCNLSECYFLCRKKKQFHFTGFFWDKRFGEGFSEMLFSRDGN